MAALAGYADDALIRLGRSFGSPHPLAGALRRWTNEIAALEEGEALDLRPADYFYRLLLYWAAETRKEDALMTPPYRPERVDEAGRRFDAAVGRIRAGELAVTMPPEAAICRECDLRALCRAEGIIGEIGESETLAA